MILYVYLLKSENLDFISGVSYVVSLTSLGLSISVEPSFI